MKLKQLMLLSFKVCILIVDSLETFFFNILFTFYLHNSQLKLIIRCNILVRAKQLMRTESCIIVLLTFPAKLIKSYNLF